MQHIKDTMHSRLDFSLLVVHSLILIIITKDSLEEKVLIIKNKTSNTTTNNLLPYKYLLNTSDIQDNFVDKTSGSTKYKTGFYTPTASINSSKITANTTKNRGNAKKSTVVLLERTFMTTTRSTKNSNITTVVPPYHPTSNPSYTSKILQYTLIPLGCVLFIIALLCMVRHIQKVKKKRRLERELLHQYSYPNSEAGDLDEEERFLEVESVINTQFNISSDQEEKNVVDEIPQVTVAIGDGSKLVMQDTQSLSDDVEASTSFNC
ncbi:uncharacterized protein LOC116297787 [Actinia tenebrosa]|uniref:Uncharacterized protein LOC116297787 n=1 Tax=Actinia tenebrosa TaxID=6105 RepID=A0A6P8I2B7_ACTTE|nr:uncharacterized protein LOC116297787 [Actinia tenebrosa]